MYNLVFVEKLLHDVVAVMNSLFVEQDVPHPLYSQGSDVFPSHRNFVSGKKVAIKIWVVCSLNRWIG